MRIQLFGEKRRFYFIGIGGISMSALAKMLLSCGYRVSGYDAAFGRQVQILKSMGVKISLGEADEEEIVRAEIVVYTDAIPKTDKRLTFAKELGKIMLSRAELLSILIGQFDRVIAVAGSHGKTTCTAMITHAISKLGVPFASHIGGEDLTFDNFTMSGTDFLVTECCEYKKNLSKIKADSAVLLNVDKDHMECFKDENDLKELFFEYLKRARTAFICVDDENCKNMLAEKREDTFITFGQESISCDYRAVTVKTYQDGCSFWVNEYGKKLCKVILHVPGRHNVYNALAAFAVLRSYGFSETEIVEGLRSFRGVRRRFENIGKVFCARAIADYAHHPSEIKATIKTAKESLMETHKGKLYVVFQPHTYSRTKHLFEEFLSVFERVENLVIYRTFAAREEYDEEGSARALSTAIGHAIYADNVHALEAYLKTTVTEEDVVLFLGAGDVYAVAQYLSRAKD